MGKEEDLRKDGSDRQGRKTGKKSKKRKIKANGEASALTTNN